MNNRLCRSLLAAAFSLVAVFSSPAQSVVVNKFFNGTPDGVELLVVGTNGPGSFVDLQGMVIKDFSGSGAGDSGGKFIFGSNSTWSSQPAGTLIVLSLNTNGVDTNTPWVVRAGLNNTNLFPSKIGTFDIATIDIVMLKQAGSDTNGVVGAIHTLANTNTGNFVTAPTPKLYAFGATGAGRFAYALNPTSTLADFDGTNGSAITGGLVFGTANNSQNAAYINFLRGITTPSLTLSLASASTTETNVAGIAGNIVIPASLSSNLIVSVSASSNGVVSFSTNLVTILAGQTNATFTVFPVTNASYASFQVSITASNGGYTPSSALFTVNNSDAPATTVVVNKYGNAAPVDTIELLVVGTNVPGSVANLSGAIVKDFSSNMDGDGGGQFRFVTNALWDSVLAGTLIVLTGDATTLDTNTPFVIKVGLLETNYFTSVGASLDIATTEMVSVKAAGTGPTGVGGAIHTLAGGTAGSLFTLTAPPKLIATGTSGAGNIVYANNSLGVLSDFNGTDATGGVTPLGSGISFGNPNTASNAFYISYLRGAPLGDGTGVATLTNLTAGTFLNKRIFERNGVGITARVEVAGANYVSTQLVEVAILVPTAFGTPTLGNLTLSGAGFSGASASVSGSLITISNALVTAVNSGIIEIKNLITPAQTSTNDPLSYQFLVTTKIAGGTLGPIPNSPRAAVATPVENVRDVNANGVPNDLGAFAALEGTGTVPLPGFSSTRWETYIQNNGYGIQVFDQAAGLVGFNLITNGGTYVVSGTIAQFRGATEIIPSSVDDIVEISGPGQPAPLAVTLPTVLGNAERYEGALVTVSAIVRAETTNTWGLTNIVYLFKEAAGTNTIQVKLSSAQQTDFFLDPGTSLVNITAIVSQDDGSTPFTSSYQLLPVFTNSYTFPATPAGYATWAVGYGLSGGLAVAGADADGDGVANLLEYAFSSNPTNGASRVLPVNSNVAGYLTIYVPRSTNAPDITYVVEGGVDLLVWQTNTTFGAGDGSTLPVASTNAVSTTPQDFLRVKVTQP